MSFESRSNRNMAQHILYSKYLMCMEEFCCKDILLTFPIKSLFLRTSIASKNSRTEKPHLSSGGVCQQCSWDCGVPWKFASGSSMRSLVVDNNALLKDSLPAITGSPVVCIYRGRIRGRSFSRETFWTQSQSEGKRGIVVDT